jgi:hypothetical protein
MVIGDARTHTFAASQPPPNAPRPEIIGLLNGPIQWGDTMWAALSWDTIAKVASGWVIREGTRQGDYEVVRQQ